MKPFDGSLKLLMSIQQIRQIFANVYLQCTITVFMQDLRFEEIIFLQSSRQMVIYQPTSKVSVKQYVTTLVLATLIRS